MRKLFAIVLFLSLPAWAWAAGKPPELQSAIASDKPVGQASLSKLFLHVYDASFWSDSGGWSKPPYALVITYDMHVSSDDLADRTYEEMKHVSNQPDGTLTHDADLLRRIYPSVSAGDRITAVQKDAATTLFYYNGKPIGKVTDANFAQAFFGIWLSPKSSEPEMQQQLTHALPEAAPAQ